MGWMEKDGHLLPVMTDLPPAPEDLLRIIRCNCTTDCSTARCSCVPLHADNADVWDVEIAA